MHIPLLAHPLGWVVLGVGGYALYKAGKKKGRENATKQIEGTKPTETSKKGA